MTGFRLVSVVVLLVLCTTPAVLFASAAPPDPRVIITDPPGSCPSVGLSFDFNADSTGAGTFCFVNSSGADWFNVEILVESPFTGKLSCSPPGDIFSTCNVGMENHFKVADFSGGTLANGMTFNITLMCDPNCFSPNGLFHVDANSVEPEPAPDPATLVLLTSGLAVSLFKRRKPAA